MSQTGNWTLVGSSLQQFVRAVSLLERKGWLWSSFCDKIGDWLVSTEDDTPLDELVEALRAECVECDIVQYGELTTRLGSVKEFALVCEMDPTVSVEAWHGGAERN